MAVDTVCIYKCRKCGSTIEQKNPAPTSTLCVSCWPKPESLQWRHVLRELWGALWGSPLLPKSAARAQDQIGAMPNGCQVKSTSPPPAREET